MRSSAADNMRMLGEAFPFRTALLFAVTLIQTSVFAATLAEQSKNEGCIGPPILITNTGLLRCAVKDGTHYFSCPGCDLSGVDVSLLPPPTPTPSVGVVTGPPTILPECADQPSPYAGAGVVGASTFARECTRQYCAGPEYQAKVQAYAMNRPQNRTDQAVAVTCISRAEADRTAK
jgi:hypothetical protein